MKTMDKDAPFCLGYVACAIWSSTDDESNPLDKSFDESDLSEDCLNRMAEDCQSFVDYCVSLGLEMDEMNEQAGHDFWLTRNGHGAGFWDGGLGKLGDQLTAAAHSFGECNLYVGDDGRLHCC